MSNTDNTFKPEVLTDKAGASLNGMIVGVELLTADPADLATHFPRVWINLTSGAMKYSLDGVAVKVVTAT